METWSSPELSDFAVYVNLDTMDRSYGEKRDYLWTWHWEQLCDSGHCPASASGHSAIPSYLLDEGQHHPPIPEEAINSCGAPVCFASSTASILDGLHRCGKSQFLHDWFWASLPPSSIPFCLCHSKDVPRHPKDIATLDGLRRCVSFLVFLQLVREHSCPLVLAFSGIDFQHAQDTLRTHKHSFDAWWTIIFTRYGVWIWFGHVSLPRWLGKMSTFTLSSFYGLPFIHLWSKSLKKAGLLTPCGWRNVCYWYSALYRIVATRFSCGLWLLRHLLYHSIWKRLASPKMSKELK